jgi:hypothetical protein
VGDFTHPLKQESGIPTYRSGSLGYLINIKKSRKIKK